MLTRFAPAPTGYLHLGHVASAMAVWGWARARDAQVLLRIEDHARVRSRPGFEAALLEDLAWLGFEPDLGAPPALCRQSERGAVYEATLKRLASATRVYACRCSRREIAAVSGEEAHVETPYPGTCRELDLPWAPGVGLRAVLGPGEERFTDQRLGALVQEPESQCGDLLVRDRLGQWTYQFAVTVDDMVKGVDVVIRGEDLLDSTGRQIRLARLLGREAPATFLHHELLTHPDGTKLSKANRDTAIRDLRAAGRSAAEVLGMAGDAIP
jgi:glutamyl-tRNA synthetase/glutamyl-Q tRNA(Asp) synthetase